MRAEIEKFGHLHITGFIDSFWTGSFGAYPVITPNNVPAAHRTCAVMVIANQHFQEIAQWLAPLGFSDIRDVGSYILKHVDLIQAAQKLEDLPLAEVARRKEGGRAHQRGHHICNLAQFTGDYDPSTLPVGLNPASNQKAEESD